MATPSKEPRNKLRDSFFNEEPEAQVDQANEQDLELQHFIKLMKLYEAQRSTPDRAANSLKSQKQTKMVTAFVQTEQDEKNSVKDEGLQMTRSALGESES